LAEFSGTSEDGERLHDGRLRAEQLRSVVKDTQRDSLSAVSWAIMLSGFFSFYDSPLGLFSVDKTGIWVGLMFSWALVAWLLVKKFRRTRLVLGNTQRWLQAFGSLYFANGIVWSVLVLLLWQPANYSNNMFLTVIIFGLIITYVVQMNANNAVFLAAVSPPTLTLWLSFMFKGEDLALMFTVLVPCFFFWIFWISRIAGARVISILELQFHNEDLLRDLSHARDDAIRQRADAERANLAKSTFMANMSHELRTPLNAILGFSEMIQREIFGPTGSPRYIEYANDIHQSGDHLLTLINDILDLTKIESGKMELDREEFEINELVTDCIRMVTESAESGAVRLVFDGATPSPIINADNRAIKQAVLNLLSNGIKFTPPDGLVSIATKIADRDDLVITVSDTGIGISPDEIDAVMQPFEQVDNRYDRAQTGTGLGLAMVKSLVGLHGGTCTLDSIVDEGTVATIRLPGATSASCLDVVSER